MCLHKTYITTQYNTNKQTVQWTKELKKKFVIPSIQTTPRMKFAINTDYATHEVCNTINTNKQTVQWTKELKKKFVIPSIQTTPRMKFAINTDYATHEVCNTINTDY